MGIFLSRLRAMVVTNTLVKTHVTKDGETFSKGFLTVSGNGGSVVLLPKKGTFAQELVMWPRRIIVAYRLSINSFSFLTDSEAVEGGIVCWEMKGHFNLDALSAFMESEDAMPMEHPDFTDFWKNLNYDPKEALIWKLSGSWRSDTSVIPDSYYPDACQRHIAKISAELFEKKNMGLTGSQGQPEYLVRAPLQGIRA